MYLCIGAVYLFIIIRITSFSYSELLTMYVHKTATWTFCKISSFVFLKKVSHTGLKRHKQLIFEWPFPVRDGIKHQPLCQNECARLSELRVFLQVTVKAGLTHILTWRFGGETNTLRFCLLCGSFYSLKWSNYIRGKLAMETLAFFPCMPVA